MNQPQYNFEIWLEQFSANIIELNKTLPIELTTYIPTIEELEAERERIAMEAEQEAFNNFVSLAHEVGFSVRTFDPATQTTEEYEREVAA